MKKRAIARRRLVLTLPVLLAGGCGFHPVYERSADGTSAARAGLGLIAVSLIPDRPGQLLRQALQARIDRGETAAKRFDLVVWFGLSAEALSIQTDNTATRVRYVGRTTWSLLKRDATRATVTSGSAHAMDGLNTFDQQYFAQDLETETVERRLADALAEQITGQLVAYFDQHPV
jgi:LPS-assembly lipoprotein